jgi:carbonic anhydrase/acetyltransferase-like protein (isoleucine patch superfamily)
MLEKRLLEITGSDIVLFSLVPAFKQRCYHGCQGIAMHAKCRRMSLCSVWIGVEGAIMDEDSIDLSFRRDLVGESSFIAPNATVRGDVQIGKSCTVLFGAVLRGDADSIHVGDFTNIQDLVCVHADPGVPCHIGDRVTVGHGAILNGAVIGKGSVVAAGALVTEGKVIPPNSLVMGIPAKVVREAMEREHSMIERGWKHYVEIGAMYQKQFDLESKNEAS